MKPPRPEWKDNPDDPQGIALTVDSIREHIRYYRSKGYHKGLIFARLAAIATRNDIRTAFDLEDNPRRTAT